MVKQALSVFVILLVTVFVVACAQPGSTPAGSTGQEEEAQSEESSGSSEEAQSEESSDSSEAAPTSVPDTEAGDSEVSEPAGEQASELTVAMGHIPLSPNFALDTALDSTAVYNNMYEKLLGVQEGERVGILAESWEPISDTTWQLKLREGVTFQCGESFDAEDVKFTLEWHLDPDVESRWKGRLAGIESVEVVDELTVNIHTERPLARVIPNLAFIYIYPSDYFNEVGLEGFTEAPCGTGPYKMVEWVVDDYFVLEAYDGYWGGAPAIDRLTFRKVPEVASRVAGLESGDYDIIYDVSPEDATRLESAGFNINATPRGRVTMITFSATLDTPFQDKQVRQAANHCVDVQGMIDSILGGNAQQASQLVGPDAFGYNPDVEPYAYDPERGRALLAEAGYADGFDATIVASQGFFYKDTEAVEAIVAMLEANCGIRTEIQTVDSSAWYDLYFAGTMPEMFIVEWDYAPAMDADANALFFMSPEIHQRASVFMDNDEMNELYLAQGEELDADARLQLLQDLEALVHEEAVGIFLWQPPNIVALSPDVNNVSFRADTGINLVGATITP